MKHVFLCYEAIFSWLVDNTVLFQTPNAPYLEVDALWAKYFEPEAVHKWSSGVRQLATNQGKDKLLKGRYKGFGGKKDH